MGSKKCHPVSVQALLIRQIQMEVGQAPCYATATRDNCLKTGCCWRSDCYCDDEGDHPARNGVISSRNGAMDFHYARG